MPDTIAFDSYIEFKKFAYDSNYKINTRFGDMETWDTEGCKAIVLLEGGHRNFVADAPVSVRFVPVRAPGR